MMDNEKLKHIIHQSEVGKLDSMDAQNLLAIAVAQDAEIKRLRDLLNKHHMRYGSHPQYDHALDEETKLALASTEQYAEAIKKAGEV